MIEYILNINNYESLKLLILSMIPITELRFSIPYGILIMQLHWPYVVIVSVIGNIFIGFVILYILPPIIKIFKKNRYLEIFINYILNRTRKKGEIIDRLKYYGLIIFIGIPLPLSGVWTGALGAYVFGLSRLKSILTIVIGVFISSILVTILTLTGKFIFI